MDDKSREIIQRLMFELAAKGVEEKAVEQAFYILVNQPTVSEDVQGVLKIMSAQT